MKTERIRQKFWYWLLALLPIALMLWVWLSPLAFVPVPWPDDSAFYFVGKHLFDWPPRWVMISQSPFEPTYRIFNFNTMPLYPILIGLGRFVGIDGSFALKLWPLSFWALSGSLLGVALYRAGLPLILAILVVLGFGMDPVLRWASVLVRPESLIGLCGMALVLGLTLGFPKRLQRRRIWDPVAALLIIAAYAHFNAIHLVFPTVLAIAGAALQQSQGRRLRFALQEFWAIGWRGLLYLTPWFLMILSHPKLFIYQMSTQWKRLAVPNTWLDSVHNALGSLFQSMGSPEPWPSIVTFAAILMWILIFKSLLAIGLSFTRRFHTTIPLLPAAGWVLGAAWLWHTKPEVWFTYYLHAALIAFLGIALLAAWKSAPKLALSKAALGSLISTTVLLTIIFAQMEFTQARNLSRGTSWRWETYYSLIDCIDARLTQLERDLGFPKPFRVWDPTFPDVTIELSRRHPEWEFTRTNDFWERSHLAVQHGHEVEAVVVPETYDWNERTVSGPAQEHPELRSVWMNWEQYFLIQLQRDPSWKPNRWVCQRGRWQAFIYMK